MTAPNRHAPLSTAKAGATSRPANQPGRQAEPTEPDTFTQTTLGSMYPLRLAGHDEDHPRPTPTQNASEGSGPGTGSNSAPDQA